jgi:hypothetical protein
MAVWGKVKHFRQEKIVISLRCHLLPFAARHSLGVIGAFAVASLSHSLSLNYNEVK